MIHTSRKLKNSRRAAPNLIACKKLHRREELINQIPKGLAQGDTIIGQRGMGDEAWQIS